MTRSLSNRGPLSTKSNELPRDEKEEWFLEHVKKLNLDPFQPCKLLKISRAEIGKINFFTCSRSPFRSFPGATGSGGCFPIRIGPPPSAPIAPSHTAGKDGDTSVLDSLGWCASLFLIFGAGLHPGFRASARRGRARFYLTIG